MGTSVDTDRDPFLNGVTKPFVSDIRYKNAPNFEPYRKRSSERFKCEEFDNKEGEKLQAPVECNSHVFHGNTKIKKNHCRLV